MCWYGARLGPPPFIRNDMSTTTPRSINKNVLKLCSQITTGTPLYVPVRPDGSAESQQCFQNVVRKINRDGGSQCVGWRIWERPELYVEAEFHAVWRTPLGELFDITPLPDDERTILFLFDKTRPYKDRQRDNIRMPIVESLPLRNIFAAKEQQFRILNRGSRARIAEGAISLRGVEMDEYERTEHRIAVAEKMLERGLNDRSKCLCESGRAYVRCCGKLK